ncbi:MAG TPA: hypothetical protein VJC03_02260, partial [bacterium]|nr:hypothetical protein [bacterium]
MRIIKFCINMFLLAGTLAPLGAVTPGADFLTWGGGARPSALAGAYCAVSDLQSLFFNPAGLALMKFGEVSLMHNEAGEGITRDFLAYTRPLPSVQGVLGGYFIYSSVSGIREYSSSGARGNDLGASSAQTGLAYGFRAISGLYGGISVKSVRE